MPANPTEIIFPCPFSKGYGIPTQQAWGLLKVFLIYRFVLACLFIILFYSRFDPTLLGSYNSQLYIYSSYSYLLFTLVLGICVFWRLGNYSALAQWLIFTDIIILTLLMHASGGIKSNMGVLLAVSTASGGLLIGGRCAMLFAALACLSVLTEQTVFYQSHSLDTSAYSYAGMLGASFFAIAILAYILAKRSEETLQLANRQKKTIVKLEEFNQYIIQHLQSGIIIINQQQVIQMVNEAALRLAQVMTSPLGVNRLSTPLADAFQIWLTHPKQNSVSIDMPNQIKIHSRFSLLPTHDDVFYMITLEDMALYNQRLQQSKLASLGRLTASIAHEIRNPLGAISHAGQLLSENPALSDQDVRLTAIIKTHCNRVNHIIEDILQLSRRNDSRREKLSLSLWLPDYLNDFVLERGIPFDSFTLDVADQPLIAIIDLGHLKQIMDNLCQNALNYGKPELGAFTVRCFMRQNVPCIELIDHGSGISADQLKHLFEPFFTTSSSGTGLGLYLSKELAELNQAKLSYHLSDDNRTCFRLCLLCAEQTLIEI
jgi:two-component system sensor histidine kinase PilS (NtrC family)